MGIILLENIINDLINIANILDIPNTEVGILRKKYDLKSENIDDIPKEFTDKYIEVVYEIKPHEEYKEKYKDENGYLIYIKLDKQGNNILIVNTNDYIATMIYENGDIESTMLDPLAINDIEYLIELALNK